MTIKWNVRDYVALLGEYRDELKRCRDLGQMRRYKSCIGELETEIAKRRAKGKRKMPRRAVA